MKAIIQAGGKGTRISSITGDTIPKPMLEVCGYPILYHQIMNLKKSGITDIIIIIGHLGNVIKEYFKDGQDLGVKISYFEENQNNLLGTAGALYYLKDKINEDFIFLLADVFIDIDFKRMIKFHIENNAKITLFAHPNSHPFDSDLIVENNNVVLDFDYKTNDRTKYNYKNIVNAGIIIFSNEVLDLLNEEKKYSYEKDIVVPYIKTNKVYTYISTEYAKDMGTPERYEMVINDYKTGLCKKRNLENKQKAIFLDRDGTIIEYIPFLNKVSQVELLPLASEAIKKINKSEYLCIIITNQPIIARGESTIENLDEIHKRLETLLGENGAYIDKIYYCPHHPDKGFEGEVPELKIKCDCRKPNIGMLEQAVKEYNIDLSKSFIIGDSTLDIKTGENAKMKSILVKTGQKGLDNKFDINPTYISNNLFEAIEIIERGIKNEF
ncbi:MAG: HAD-IIIA family hydrolase [Bacilli bacterium]|nr:HAD-IIIA family hydrolase [Bacilli bacterium]